MYFSSFLRDIGFCMGCNSSVFCGAIVADGLWRLVVYVVCCIFMRFFCMHRLSAVCHLFWMWLRYCYLWYFRMPSCKTCCFSAHPLFSFAAQVWFAQQKRGGAYRLFSRFCFLWCLGRVIAAGSAVRRCFLRRCSAGRRRPSRPRFARRRQAARH